MKQHRYLGPSRFPQWLLRLLPFSLRFDYAAYIHDTNYALGGKELDRNKADNKLGLMMFKVSKRNIFSYVFALIYFLLVSTLGFFFFKYK